MAEIGTEGLTGGQRRLWEALVENARKAGSAQSGYSMPLDVLMQRAGYQDDDLVRLRGELVELQHRVRIEFSGTGNSEYWGATAALPEVGIMNDVVFYGFTPEVQAVILDKPH